MYRNIKNSIRELSSNFSSIVITIYTTNDSKRAGTVPEPPNQQKTALPFLKVFDYFNCPSMTKENKGLSQE